MAVSADPEVVVVGHGVAGLTTALVLSEAGRAVTVVSDRASQRTTSAVAGALWGPYVFDDPRVLDWSLHSLPDLTVIAADPRSGVRIVQGIEASHEPAVPPVWLRSVSGFAICDPSELPSGFGWGWTYRAPVFDMPVYLEYLMRRLIASGATVRLLDGPLRDLDQALGIAPVVVNCTGLGARELVDDRELVSSWGQLAITDNPGIDGFFSDFPESEDPTYWIAHPDHVVLGGMVRHGRDDLRPDPEAAERIVARCAAVLPALGRVRVRELRVGLRPVRPRVRLERSTHHGATVVHNYGHGGSGVTLSWGCARQVQSLIG
ncbi:FAD-dependent oxidoreductase [Streptomyces sp. CB01373]|uniref:FAD-dependent oxidoreductase n=1 Tax=Streptomyces sp. CB01373 TaxID=2020325 RepID=UPI000C280A0E|nr:FAD-dependent oxidoreductase [Streptomyces sp. CB01373]PJM95253.1 amino acid oxidase [Streptomyces sp. CB01373]